MKKSLPLGGMSAEQFLEEYWQKKPLLIRNAFPDFEPPVEGDDLAGLACEEMVESRLVIQNPKSNDWQLEQGPFAEDRFASLPPSHWTLLVQAVDHWVPEANALLEQFRFIPSWRIDDLMISYATQGGGVGPHYDNYDVFLLQTSGQRRWEVGGIYGEDSPRRDDTPVMILPEWDAEETFILNPGDMLYLPPRVGHNGVALTDDCITYSVGFRAPSHAEILRQFTDFVGEQLKSETRYTDPDLTVQANASEITQSAFDKVRAILTQYIDQPDLLEDWFGQFMTEPKYPEQAFAEEDEEPLQPDQVREYLNDGGLVMRSEGSRFAFRLKDDGSYILYVNGQACEVSDSEGVFVKALCNKSALAARDIKSKEALEIVTELLNLEALSIEADE